MIKPGHQAKPCIRPDGASGQTGAGCPFPTGAECTSCCAAQLAGEVKEQCTELVTQRLAIFKLEQDKSVQDEMTNAAKNHAVAVLEEKMHRALDISLVSQG